MIELQQATRTYGEGHAMVTALDHVDLRVAEGEFAVVLGPSGSGKTTLLNVVGALDSPTSGRIFLAGQEITGAS
ncbi:MAG: macrolide ABC transporter ATP-binding protein, partial [Anaerolinea sp.]|nr:macrolide ABC transporter ATP-binding protein [Anaerolinea sp.]